MSSIEGASTESSEKGSEPAKVCTFFKRSGRTGGARGGRRKRPVQSATADDDAGAWCVGNRCLHQSICLQHMSSCINYGG